MCAAHASIDQVTLMAQLAEQVKAKAILRLVWKAMQRITWNDGSYREHTRGIALGCPLSPLLLGALHLAGVDRAMSGRPWFYVRFMDDLLILAPSRRRVREAMKRLHGQFDGLRLQMHPDKTFIGRCARGFDFLGYHLRVERGAAQPPETEAPQAPATEAGDRPRERAPVSRAGDLRLLFETACGLRLHLTPAASAQNTYFKHSRRLYERGAGEDRIGDYLRRWELWFRAGISTVPSTLCARSARGGGETIYQCWGKSMTDFGVSGGVVTTWDAMPALVAYGSWSSLNVWAYQTPWQVNSTYNVWVYQYGGPVTYLPVPGLTSR
jgi:hypothetical protein